MLASQTDATVATVFAPRTTIDADGTVEGYASLFGEIDQARDMVLRGAFADTLRTRGVNRIPMLFQHDPAEPVGVWLELREDARGLYARGRLIPEVTRGARAALFTEGGRHRRAVDRLPHGQGPHRSAHPHPQPAGGGLVGDLHRHLPAAGGGARARREAGVLPAAGFTRAHARRAGVGEGGARGLRAPTAVQIHTDTILPAAARSC